MFTNNINQILTSIRNNKNKNHLTLFQNDYPNANKVIFKMAYIRKCNCAQKTSISIDLFHIEFKTILNDKNRMQYTGEYEWFIYDYKPSYSKLEQYNINRIDRSIDSFKKMIEEIQHDE